MHNRKQGTGVARNTEVPYRPSQLVNRNESPTWSVATHTEAIFQLSFNLSSMAQKSQENWVDGITDWRTTRKPIFPPVSPIEEYNTVIQLLVNQSCQNVNKLVQYFCYTMHFLNELEFLSLKAITNTPQNSNLTQISKGPKLKNYPCRVTALGICTSPQCVLSTYEVSKST